MMTMTMTRRTTNTSLQTRMLLQQVATVEVTT